MKIGDYVRTDDGIISKITSILDEYIFIEDKRNYYYGNLVEKSKINKSSPNIIDLIEVGDIITTNNLCGEITKIDENKIYTTCYDGEYCSVEDIKSIVTKEQFQSMEYRIGE